MTVSVLQERETSAAGASASLALAFSSNTTAGSSIHTSTTWGTAASSDWASVADTSNTYSAKSDIQNSAGHGQSMGHAWAQNIAGGADTVTMTYNSTPAFVGLIIREIGGAAAASIDGHNSATQTGISGTDAATVSATNTAQPALVSGISFDIGGVGTPVNGTGFGTSGIAAWVFGGATNDAKSEDKRVTSAASQSATFTPAGVADYFTFIGIFDETGAAGSGDSSTPILNMVL